MTAPDEKDDSGSAEAPGVGGDARLHDLGGDMGRSPSGNRGGGGLGPHDVRELQDDED